jgi:hypothetical protein
VAAATAKRKFRAARNTQGDRLDAGRNHRGHSAGVAVPANRA